MQVTRARASSIGAEVRGLDLGLPQPQAVVDALTALLFERHVLVFRDQRLDATAQVALAGLFGAAVVPEESGTLSTHFHGQPEIQRSSFLAADGTVPLDLRPSQADTWHTDYSYLPSPPELACLYGVEIPSDGPETLFLDMRSAWQALPAAEKSRLGGLRGRHSQKGALDPAAYRLPPYLRPGQADDGSAERCAVHPLVRRHPRSDGYSLYLSHCYMTDVEGLSPPESRELIRALYDHADRPEFTYRHSWRAGDFILWDNVATNHRRSKPIDRPRVLHRVTIALAPLSLRSESG